MSKKIDVPFEFCISAPERTYILTSPTLARSRDIAERNRAEQRKAVIDMADESAVSQILQKLKNCVKKGEPIDLSSLASLVGLEPERWLSLLFLEGVIPNPMKDSVQRELKSLFDGMALGVESSPLSAKHLMAIVKTIHSVLLLHTAHADVKEQLASLSFWGKPAEVIYRLGAYVQSQMHLAMAKQMSSAVRGETYDPVAALSSNLTGQFSGAARQDVQQTTEELHECVELIVRYIIHAHASKAGYGDLDGLGSPYEDEEFGHLIRLANVRRGLEEVWGRIAFLGWMPLIEEERTGYIPPDPEEFLRAETGSVRSNLFMNQTLLVEMAAGAYADTDSIDRLLPYVKTLALPDAGAAWDGQSDLSILKDCCRRTVFLRSAEYWITLRHYTPLLSKVVIGAHATWRDWLLGTNALRTLGAAFQMKIEAEVRDLGGHGCLRSVAVVRRPHLVEVLEVAAGLSRASAMEVLESLVFDVTRRNREIWDQPLLPLGGEDLLFIPGLVGSANASRAVENIVADALEDFGVRGVPFEKAMETWLRANSSAKVSRAIKFDASDREVEFDLVLWWQRHLILIETKCLKSIHSPSDMRRAREQVDYAVSQLIRRRGIAVSDWALLKAHAPELELPDAPPAAESIICIALTNLLEFTGLVRDGVVVTDDLCLRRYFGDPRVVPLTIGPSGWSEGPQLAPIRVGPATPAGLREYLIHPPQVEEVRKHIKTAWMPVLGVGKDAKPIFVLSSEFDGQSSERVYGSSALAEATPTRQIKRTSRPKSDNAREHRHKKKLDRRRVAKERAKGRR